MSKKIPAIIYLILLFFFVGVLAGCFGMMPRGMGMQQQNAKTAALLSNLLPGQFGKLWTKRTIQLSTAFDNSPGSSGGREFGGGGGFFPLIANATLIDSELIECGLQEFVKLSEMSKEEIIEFKGAYKQKFETDNYYLVWLELKTPYSANILDLERWNIYWMDNQGKKYEPAKTIEYVGYADETNQKLPMQELSMVKQDSTHKESAQWNISSKTIYLFFSKENTIGEKVIDKKTETLTLVIFDWNNRNVKHEGTWDLKSLH